MFFISTLDQNIPITNPLDQAIAEPQEHSVDSALEQQDHWSIKAIQWTRNGIQKYGVDPVRFGAIEVLSKGSEASLKSIAAVIVSFVVTSSFFLTGKSNLLKRLFYSVAAIYSADFISKNEVLRNSCSTWFSFITSLRISREPTIEENRLGVDTIKFPEVSFPVAIGIGSLAIGALAISVISRKKTDSKKIDSASKKNSGFFTAKK